MLDTLCLDVHDLSKHAELIKFLEMSGMDIPTESYGVKETIDDLPTTMPDEGLPMHRKSRFLMLDNHRKVKDVTQHVIKSSHYKLSYFINWDKDCISFNFSVPKYIWGTNICQFVPSNRKHQHKGVFDDSELLEMKEICKLTYPRLIKFINHFLSANFPVTVYRELIQIKRIDLCYNQYFQSEEDALQHLQDLKKVNRKYTREGTLESNETKFGTSFTSKGSGYLFKVYHKGKEYQINDAKAHKEMNAKHREKHGKNLFDIPFLQKTANNILRYEITFHNEYLNYVFINRKIQGKHLYNRNNDTYWRLFTTMRKAKRQVETSKMTTITDAKGKTREVLVSSTWTRNFKQHLNHYSKIIGHRFKFMLSLSMMDSQYFNDREISFMEPIPRYALFDERLFLGLCQVFIDQIKQYQIKEAKSISDIQGAVKRDNQLKKDNPGFTWIKKRSIRQIENALIIFNQYDWNIGLMIKDEIMPKSTAYRWRSYFEKNHAINKLNIATTTICNSARYDFMSHYEFMMAFRAKHPNIIVKQ